MARLAAALAGCALVTAAAARGGDVGDPLAERGYAVTSGAAPGYVDDRACAGCHADLYRAYREVGMAQAFFRPRPERVIEDFEQGFYHPKSGRHYRMTLRDGRYVFRRHQLDAAGRPVHVFEQAVDWILGSGHHARTYLYRSPEGELYQLPLAWYTQTGSWGMAPGYDRPDHLGVTRRVRRECMFCHNAYPDVPAGSDLSYDGPQTFPAELPEGLGCQRCHGPGAEHARTGMREPVDPARLASTILNPGRLPPRLRDDVCYECHMQPSVALAGVRRFGRGDYSFRPGEPLADYLVQVDVDEEGRERSERFEINHHPYRLEQSRCFEESAGALSCLTCHDPHRKVKEPERAAHYRAACLGCHQVDACGLEAMVVAAPGAADPGAALPAADPSDCAACHMQKRRTQDVVQVVMTDHLIRRRPASPAELQAPLEESEPVLVGVELIDERAPSGSLGEVYRAAAVVRAGGGGDAVDRLRQALDAVRPDALEPWFDLGRGQLQEQRFEAAEATLLHVLERSRDHPVALAWLAIARQGRGRTEEALALVRRAIDAGERAEWYSNLGQMLNAAERPADALAPLERAIERRPSLAAAHFQLGNALAALDRRQEAVASYRRALAVEPTHPGARRALDWIRENWGLREGGGVGAR